MVGRTIDAARVLDERWTRPEPPRALEAEVKGRRIEDVRRRGKYLIVDLEGDRHLVMHLRMTGNLLIAGAERFGGPRLYESEPDARFLRAVLELDDGSELWFTDARRFGHGVVLSGDELWPYLDARLGIEPLGGELTGESPGAPGRGADGTAEVVPARSAAGGRCREHLRGRGALAGGAAPALAGWVDASGALRGAGRGNRRGARGWACQRRLVDRRLPRRARRAGLDAGRVPGAYARGP